MNIRTAILPASALLALYGDLSFDRDSGTNTPGSGSDNALDPIPGGSFFISHELDEHWSVGFGQYGDFGLAVNSTMPGFKPWPAA